MFQFAPMKGEPVLTIRLIQALYDDRSPLPDDSSYYTRTLRSRDFTAVAPQVFHILKQQGRLNQIPTFFRDSLKEAFNDTCIQNIFIKNQTEQLLQKLEDDRIDVIPLKGTRFAEKYFGHTGARRTSDIDL